METSDVSHRIRSGPFTEWSLGFGHFSSRLVIRVLTGVCRDGFGRSRLLEPANVLFGFRVQVGSTTQGYHAQPLPSFLGIIHAAMRRTLVKNYGRAAGIDPDRLGGRGIGIHSLRKTAINDAIRNGASMHEVREFAGHSDIRTTEVYFVRKEEDAEVAARRIQIRLTGSRGQ